MHFDGRNRVPNAIARTWELCADAREWYARAPTPKASSFSLLYRLELLYCTIVFLSPSYGDPDICDFSRVLLFDRCIDYVSQLHQVLEKPGSLPFITCVDIQRLCQVGRLLVRLLNESYDLLLSNELPEPPATAPGTPEPPYLAAEDRINCHSRAARCLQYIGDLLQYGSTRWKMDNELNNFTRDSLAVRGRLLQEGSPSQTVLQIQPYSLPASGHGGLYYYN
jgi:hypothetical protein